ncbi:MAG: hypothetical protein MUE73_08770 [Planctomycetes bacterium]|nr:hypothetical protein [Planctomycetota bacterium]
MSRPALFLLAIGLLPLPFAAAWLASGPGADGPGRPPPPLLDPPAPPDPDLPEPLELPEPPADAEPAVDEPDEAPPPDDPFEAVAAVVRGNVAVDPVLRDFDLLVLSREPYLLFVDKSAGEERAKEVGAEVADLLDGVHREVLARLGAELCLRPLRDLGEPDMRVLRVLVFTTEEAADRSTGWS